MELQFSISSGVALQSRLLRIVGLEGDILIFNILGFIKFLNKASISCQNPYG